MAPEQASGKRGAVTTATDVYGLGAILYAMLTGSAPFGSDSVIDTLEQVRERLPDPPRKRNPRVPRDLEVICLKCLEKDPRRRYGSAEALAEDLHRRLAGEPIAARAVGRIERARLWLRRHPTAAALSATSIVALIAMSATGFFIAYNGELKRANRVISESRANLQTAYASEASARRQAEAAEQVAAEQRALAVNALVEARNALDLANYLYDALHTTLTKSQPELPLSFTAVDWPAFKEAMSKNQTIAERLAFVTEETKAEMLRGVKSRGRLTSNRWQAYYDLILAELLATKIRCYEYNWACARMKKDPPKHSNTKFNAWRLVPAETVLYSEKAAEAARGAKSMLKRVVDEHAGTPWAREAERELKQPLSFSWVETYVEPSVRETEAAAKAAKQH